MINFEDRAAIIFEDCVTVLAESTIVVSESFRYNISHCIYNLADI